MRLSSAGLKRHVASAWITRIKRMFFRTRISLIVQRDNLYSFIIHSKVFTPSFSEKFSPTFTTGLPFSLKASA